MLKYCTFMVLTCFDFILWQISRNVTRESYAPEQSIIENYAPALVAYKICQCVRVRVFSILSYPVRCRHCNVLYGRLTNTGKDNGGPEMGTTALGHGNW